MWIRFKEDTRGNSVKILLNMWIRDSQDGADMSVTGKGVSRNVNGLSYKSFLKNIFCFNISMNYFNLFWGYSRWDLMFW